MCHHVISSRCADPLWGRCFTVCRKLLILFIFHLQPQSSSSDFTVDQQICSDPGYPEHGSRILSLSSRAFLENDVVRFSCSEGFRLKGPTKMVCARLHDGTMGWKPNVKPVCLPEDCAVPYVEDADVFYKTYRPGDQLIVSCHGGFQIRYPDTDTMQSVCQDDGTWANLPICQGCLRPMVPPHSYVNLSETEFSLPVGTVVHYQCFPGYKLDGTELLECMYSLIWSSVPPRCLEVEVCSLPPMVEHGDYVCHPQPCDGYIHGTVVEFYCDPGYTLANDYRYITCQYGQWFPHIQVYCVQTETSWPKSEESLTTWKLMSFTATSVLLALLLVTLIKVFPFRGKTHCQLRDQNPDSSSPNFLVVDGIPVLLPSYDEAVGNDNSMPPNAETPGSMGSVLHPEDQGPPAYPGHVPTIRGVACSMNEFETCESLSDSMEQLQSICPSSMYTGGLSNLSERTNVVVSVSADTNSTSPSIDIADEMPLVEDGTEDC
ncbi:sushi domain-containing protein 4 isoform X2 [Scleropages formosus]|uniref:sushi domain-containing protein 4 isoform X2 n=1 Tax=Scleropages formosus TaxID=113540 RepID=UPI0008785A20|nr:sushi domain-containing protein 4 isoform X2 [Scleropages formosus]